MLGFWERVGEVKQTPGIENEQCLSILDLGCVVQISVLRGFNNLFSKGHAKFTKLFTGTQGLLRCLANCIDFSNDQKECSRRVDPASHTARELHSPSAICSCGHSYEAVMC